MSDFSGNESIGPDSFISSLPEGASLLDNNLKIQSINSRWEKTLTEFELSPEKVGPGNKYPEILRKLGCPEETVEKLTREIRGIIKGENGECTEEIKVRAGGSIRWCEVKISGFGDGVLVLKEDVSIRKKKEKQKADALFDNSTSAIAMLNSAGEIIDINDEFEEVFGYNLSEIRGEHLDDVLEWGREGYASREKTEKILQGKKSRGKGARFDKWGNEKEFLFHGVPIIIEGEVEGAYTLYDDITELKSEREKLEETKKELEETKNHLEAILESIQDGIAVLNPDFSIRYANSTMDEWYEENAPLEGKTCYRIHHELDKPCAECHVLRTLKTGEAAAKIEQPDYNPEVDYLELYSYPMIDDETGEITGIVELSRDISERKKAERELEMTKFCLDKANMMLLRVSPEGIIRYANERACEKLGYDRDELIGSRAKSLVAEKSPVLERNEFWQEIKSSGSFVYEREFETKEGIAFPVHLISQYFEYEGEEFEMVFARDIKERKEMEKELRIREEQYRKIFETSPVGILVQDEEGNILEVNDKLCEITNYNKDELEGSSIFDTLINSEKTEKIREIMERILAGDDLSLTEKFRTKNGEVYYARLEKTRFKLPGGEEGLLSMLMDITTLKEKEANLEYLSYHDGLTDLYNRSYLEKEMARLDTERQLPVSLIMCDVNRLKLVNDTYGHNKGDELLKKVADILRDCTRGEDIVSRWAGDEFVILLPQTEAEEAERVVRRIEKACEGVKLEDIPITLSVGRATRINMEEELEEILSRADERMYRDKINRINNYENRLIKNMLDSLAAKSAETNEHAMRMTELAYKLGEELDLPNEQLNRLTLLATLHDIGKITISEDILKKPEELSGEEWVKIKMHPEKGHTILTATDDFAHIAREVLHHHERWDGTGYPEGLAEKEIPLLSRIIAIVDAYDVMITGRPYKDSISKEKALAEIKACAGSQFDPELAEQFVALMKSEKEGN